MNKTKELKISQVRKGPAINLKISQVRKDTVINLKIKKGLPKETYKLLQYAAIKSADRWTE